MEKLTRAEFAEAERRAAAGDALALATLAVCYEDGAYLGEELMCPDWGRAKTLWLQAATAGYRHARFCWLRLQIKHLRRNVILITRAALFFAAQLIFFAAILSPFLILGYQALVWLKTADWPEFPASSFLASLGMETGNWTSSDWEGFNVVVEFLLQAPMALVTPIVGVALAKFVVSLAPEFVVSPQVKPF